MITVHAGEMFNVDFQATPATGYQWSAAGVPSGLELVDDSFTPPPGPAMVPATGTHTFHFVATAAGAVELHFVLRRSWEAAGIDQRTVQVQVLP